MKQLQNINHTFDTPINQVGVTIRKGPSWSDHHTPIGTLLKLRVCEGAHHDGVCLLSCEHHGMGIKLGSWYGQMRYLPEDLLALEHNKDARDWATLYEMLQHAFPGFNEETYVTALIYLRLAQ